MPASHAARYLARPPVGRERLEEQPDGSVLLRLKTPWSDGTAAIHLSRSELLQRLFAIVPPPRKNDVLFHGIFAPRAAWRSEIVPSPPADATPEHLRVRLTRDVVTSTRSPWYPWASLLWRVFHEDVVECPHCHQPMRVRAVVLAPATLRITASLDQSAARAPPAFDGDLPDHELALAT